MPSVFDIPEMLAQEILLNREILKMDKQIREIEARDAKLPTDAKDRKTYPVGTGFLDYFPLAAAEVAHVSYVGNEQHNPGMPVHWDRSKSGDEADALIRHFLERGKMDIDGLRHSAKLAWRAMALLEKELEAAKK
jgi:hypothetical protein